MDFKIMRSGKIIWITGLSGSGKISLANALSERFILLNKPVVMLDGDELRLLFKLDSEDVKSYDRESRIIMAMKYARLCQIVSEKGVTVIIATISLFKEVHEWNRLNLKNYFEIYLDVPIDELRRRDSKGIYRNFDSGQLTNVAGLDLKIDKPTTPDLICNYVPKKNVDDWADEIIKNLTEGK